MSTWHEQLRDPRWQRKRLEIMQRENFKCEVCKTTEKTLNVHHGYYKKDLEPWEYHSGSLHCVCEECHQKTHALLDEIKETLGHLGPKSAEFIDGILDALCLIQGKLTFVSLNSTQEYWRGVVRGSGSSDSFLRSCADEDGRIYRVSIQKKLDENSLKRNARRIKKVGAA